MDDGYKDHQKYLNIEIRLFSPLLKFLAPRQVATASIYQKSCGLFLIWSICGLVVFSSSAFYFGTDEISIDYHNFSA